jgi:hypothetical protein
MVDVKGAGDTTMAKQNSGAGKKTNTHVSQPPSIKPARKVPMPPTTKRTGK